MTPDNLLFFFCSERLCSLRCRLDPARCSRTWTLQRSAANCLARQMHRTYTWRSRECTVDFLGPFSSIGLSGQSVETLRPFPAGRRVDRSLSFQRGQKWKKVQGEWLSLDKGTTARVSFETGEARSMDAGKNDTRGRLRRARNSQIESIFIFGIRSRMQDV